MPACAPARTFWRHVSHGACVASQTESRATLCLLLIVLDGQAKVVQLDIISNIETHVGWLQVPIDDVEIVEVFEGGCDVVSDGETLREESVLSLVAKVQEPSLRVALVPLLCAALERIVETVEDNEEVGAVRIAGRHPSHLDDVGMSDDGKESCLQDKVSDCVDEGVCILFAAVLHDLECVAAIGTIADAVAGHEVAILNEALETILVAVLVLAPEDRSV